MKTEDLDKNEIFERFMFHRNNSITLSNKYLAQPEGLKETLPFKKLRLSVCQINIIRLLYTKDGAMSLGEIARNEGLYKQTITQPANSLVKLGILRRFQKPDNYRYVYVELTDYGKSLYKEQSKLRNDYLMNEFYSVATVEEVKKLADFNEFFCKILTRFEEESEKRR